MSLVGFFLSKKKKSLVTFFIASFITFYLMWLVSEHLGEINNVINIACVIYIFFVNEAGI